MHFVSKLNKCMSTSFSLIVARSFSVLESSKLYEKQKIIISAYIENTIEKLIYENKQYLPTSKKYIWFVEVNQLHHYFDLPVTINICPDDTGKAPDLLTVTASKNKARKKKIVIL